MDMKLAGLGPLPRHVGGDFLPCPAPLRSSNMPWTAEDMKRKGVRRKAAVAARMANAILEKTGDEGKAIRIAMKYANDGPTRRPRR